MTDATAGKSLSDCVRHFTPAWFAVIMGTGAISILFHAFPFGRGSEAMNIFSAIFFFLNLLLFVLFNILTAARYAMFPHIWPIMLRHPVQSLYLGCYPMGATTLINVGVVLLDSEWHWGGKKFIYILWALWWVDVAISVVCAFPLVHYMKAKQDHALSRMTAVWILPVVTLIVASSTGGVLAGALVKYSVDHALLTLTASTVMLAAGEAMAFMLLTIYFFRLIVHGIPQGGSVISTFIPLGPMSQGGYSFLLLGSGFRSVLPLKYDSSDFLISPHTGEIIDVFCICLAVVLWSIATMWLLFALLAVYEILSREKFVFKLPTWGLIFPNGVYANLTISLYNTFGSHFFRIWGCITAAAVLALWTGVFVRTLTFVRNGSIFEAPCLEEMDMARSRKHTEDAPECGTAMDATR
ncbi:voltage-dependent anion channel [Cristinia sonorae]|uniref:Voltage-dependent anion channel n=1 Tax=Cristinia sonorae TaxID=1940300 RepID=A0A8K0UEX2_9AGAR|nr:voltage-dependent anion channel [Cristinia sonorae]